MMAKTVNIYGISSQARVKLKVLAAGHGVSMSKFIEMIIEEEWNSNKTTVTKQAKKKIRRILKKYDGAL